MRRVPILFLILVSVLCGAVANGQSDPAAVQEREIILWMPGSGENSNWSWTTLKDQYEEMNPDVSIEYALIPWSEYFTKLNAAFAGGLSPDVFGLGYGQMGPVQDNGHCLPLDEPLKDWDGWNDIPEGILNASLKDGKHWSIMMPDIKIFYYRKDLFAEKGLEPPKTTDELLEYARLFTQKESGNTTFVGYEISTSNGEQDFFNTYLMFGGKEFWTLENKPTYNTPLGIEVAEYLNTFVQEGLTSLVDEHALAGGPFENGIAAMTVEGSGAMVKFEEKMPGKVAMALPPGGICMAGATFLNVSAHSKHPETAVDLLRYFLEDESLKIIYKGEGKPPIRKSSMDWFLEEGEHNDVVFEALQTCLTYGQMNPFFFDFLKYVRPALEEIYYGALSADEAFAKAEKAYLEAIK